MYGTDFEDIYEAYEIIHNISSLTHGHKRSQIACGIYISVASNLIGGMGLETAVDLGIYRAMKYYKDREDYINELKHFERLEMKNFVQIPEEEIKSSGCVFRLIRTVNPKASGQ